MVWNVRLLSVRTVFSVEPGSNTEHTSSISGVTALCTISSNSWLFSCPFEASFSKLWSGALGSVLSPTNWIPDPLPSVDVKIAFFVFLSKLRGIAGIIRGGRLLPLVILELGVISGATEGAIAGTILNGKQPR